MKIDLNFSVVVAVYNKESYIEKTINSILAQSFTNFEIVVVNDGSTDNSLRIIENIHDSRIRIYSKENGGVSAARNYGIKLSKYPYIAFLDADDWWDPSFLGNLYELILKYPQAAIYSSSYAEVFGTKKFPSVTYKQLPAGQQIIDYVEVFLKKMISPINSSSIVIKKEILTSFSFNENITTGEDLLLWLQIASKYQIAYINEVLSYYNRNIPQSITQQLIPIKKNFILYIKTLLPNNTEKMNFLIDSLIVNMLRPYYLFNASDSEVNSILSSVDLKKQNIKHILFYKLPKPLVRYLYTKIKKYRIL